MGISQQNNSCVHFPLLSLSTQHHFAVVEGKQSRIFFSFNGEIPGKGQNIYEPWKMYYTVTSPPLFNQGSALHSFLVYDHMICEELNIPYS